MQGATIKPLVGLNPLLHSNTFDTFSISCIWKYYGKCSICSLGANAPVSKIVSKAFKTWHKVFLIFFNYVLKQKWCHNLKIIPLLATTKVVFKERNIHVILFANSNLWPLNIYNGPSHPKFILPNFFQEEESICILWVKPCSSLTFST